MTTTTVTRQIQAPTDRVFAAVSDIRNFSTAIPHIVDVQFLTDQKTGVGTRFKETRNMNGREASTVLEVTEYEMNEHIRLVSDSHGTVWDTVFTVEPKDGGTLLTMVMDARPHRLLARLTTPLMKGMIQKEIEKDLDLVKSYCEG